MSALLGGPYTTAHTISSVEITLTECDLMLATVPDTTRGDTTRYALTSRPGDVAIWPEAEWTSGELPCAACSNAYNQ